MKRGQITIFIIIGIVLLFVFGFAVYMFRLAQIPNIELETGPELDKAGCLERASEHVLLQVAGGGVSPTVYVDGRLVLPPETYFEDDQIPREAYQNYTEPLYNGQLRFGLYDFPPLCLRNGANRPNASFDNYSSCMSGTYQLFEPNEEVIQWIIEDELNKALVEANCSVYGHATVILGTDDVTISTANATAVVPMRLKRMHNAAVRIMQEEIRSLDFNLSDADHAREIIGCNEPGYGNICLLPEMTTTIQYDRGDEGKHNVTITDTFKKINGEYPVYRFAIQNRKPILVEYPNRGALNYEPRQITVEARVGRDSPWVKVDVNSTDPDDEKLKVVCKEESDGNYNDLQIVDGIEVSCTQEGIFIKAPTCVSENYRWSVDNLHYEACEVRDNNNGACVSVTIPSPDVRIDTGAATANFCCGQPGGPSEAWCCQYRSNLGEPEAEQCCEDHDIANGYSCDDFD